MHLPRTEQGLPAMSAQPVPSRARLVPDPFAWLRRLNVRLTLMLAGVAVLALMVSAVALYQILPDYFLEQARQRAETAETASALRVRERAEAYPSLLYAKEVRDTQIIQTAAEYAANNIVLGTLEIYYPDGSLAARGEPSPEKKAQWEAQGLRADPEVVPRPLLAGLEIPAVETINLTYRVSSPYTYREATLGRVRGSLLAAGGVALLVSLIVGVLGARVLTRPLARLRRVANRFSQGELAARADPSTVLEVEELGHSFNVMADRLSESLHLLEADRDRLREFVADVSHELRTPIAALRTFTELQRDTDLAAEQRQEFLDRSTQQINRLEWMSNNLLDLSRIDAGIFPMDVHWGDLRDPVRAVVEALAEQAGARGISLSFEVPAEPVMLSFDRERIVQLLSNLLGNALKFTPQGGEIIAEMVARPDEAIIEVRDSGPGIPEADLPLVFDRFFRGTNVGEARASGSGLGLAIARSIVEMHGGTISVSSVLGEGATFTVRIPRRQDPSEQGQ
jgi:signal transduction histidine kinase